MNDADRGILIAIIVAIIIIVIAFLAILLYSNRSNQPQSQSSQSGTTEYPSYIAPIWGDNQLVGVCTGYRFPPINSTTPAVARNTANVEGLTPYNGGFNCTWNDELNRQLVQRTCLQGICTDDQGNTYQEGGTAIFSSSCGGRSKCSGDLGLISIGQGSNAYGCLSIEVDDNVGVSTCDLFKYNQYMIVNHINEYLVQILTRDYDYSLTVIDGNVGFIPTPLAKNGGVQWLIIPPMVVRTSGSARTMEAPPQIGYVGDLPDTVINDPNNYKSMTTLRNLLIESSVRTLIWRNGVLGLAPWKLVLAGAIPSRDYYDNQASTYVSVNRLSQIPSILSQP